MAVFEVLDDVLEERAPVVRPQRVGLQPPHRDRASLSMRRRRDPERRQAVEQAQGPRPVRGVPGPELFGNCVVRAVPGPLGPSPCNCTGRRDDPVRPWRNIAGARAHVGRQDVRDPARGVQVPAVAGHLVQRDELGPERRRLVGLQHAGARTHVAVVAPGMRVQVVRERQVGPAGRGGRQPVREPVVGHQAHVGHERRITEIRVEQVPRRERHRDLIPAEATRIVGIRRPDLVLQVVRHAVGAPAHPVPELPDEANHVVVRRPGIVGVPREQTSGSIQPHLVVAKRRAGIGGDERRRRREGDDEGGHESHDADSIR